jgi:hypothetical protein
MATTLTTGAVVTNNSGRLGVAKDKDFTPTVIGTDAGTSRKGMRVVVNAGYVTTAYPVAP